MSETFTHWAAEISLYSGKTRCYLRHKRMPFKEKSPNLYTFFVTLPRRVNAAVMPVVTTPEGEWLGDTSAIIDRLEARFPEPAVVPATPVQRFAAYLFEMWGDEFWLPVAMHARWSHPENLPLFQREVGAQMLPGFPRFLQDRAGNHFADMMRAHLPRLGVGPHYKALIDRWMSLHLDALDRHLATTPFILGTRPSLADYGMIGPLYAHLGRDPWPAKNLIAPRRNLQAWVTRMNQPLAGAGGFFADDHLPATLDPALRSIFDELVPYLDGILAEVNKAAAKHPAGQALPRFLGEVAYPYAGDTYRRQAMSYVLWMAQRALDVLAKMPSDEQACVRNWVRAQGGERFLALDIPRLRRVGLSIAVESGRSSAPNIQQSSK